MSMYSADVITHHCGLLILVLKRSKKSTFFYIEKIEEMIHFTIIFFLLNKYTKNSTIIETKKNKHHIYTQNNHIKILINKYT